METQSLKTLFILPCAGFGERMGKPQSKELLINPKTNRPYIEFALETIQKFPHAKKVHIVTRAEKVDLIDYLKTISLELNLEMDIQIIKPSKEWPDTVLQSENSWHMKNILVLPDTEFSPPEILNQINSSLDQSDLVFATFATNQISSFGALAFNNGEYLHAEKPTADNTLSKTNVDCMQKAQAWGLIGFNNKHGNTLFTQMLKSTFDHEWRALAAKVNVLSMTHFADLTREKEKIK